jgi:hypothetical protein
MRLDRFFLLNLAGCTYLLLTEQPARRTSWAIPDTCYPLRPFASETLLLVLVDFFRLTVGTVPYFLFREKRLATVIAVPFLAFYLVFPALSAESGFSDFRLGNSCLAVTVAVMVRFLDLDPSLLRSRDKLTKSLSVLKRGVIAGVYDIFEAFQAFD